MSEQSAVLTSWTQEQDDFIRAQYRAISTKAIGERLGKTKNAIIGRANRLGLTKPYREVFGHADAPKQYRQPRKRRGDELGPERLNRRPKEKGSAKLTEADISPLNGVGVKIWEIENKHCRWVVGEPQDLLFCGHDKEAGSSYCLAHSRLSKQEQK